MYCKTPEIPSSAFNSINLSSGICVISVKIETNAGVALSSTTIDIDCSLSRPVNCIIILARVSDTPSSAFTSVLVSSGTEARFPFAESTASPVLSSASIFAGSPCFTESTLFCADSTPSAVLSCA